MKTKPRNMLVLGLLLLSASALGGCALCHGLDNHHAQEIRGKYWDHSNMQW